MYRIIETLKFQLLKAVAFYRALLAKPVIIMISVSFILLKLWTNIEYGSSLLTGLRSGIIGIVAYGIAIGVIHLLSPTPHGLNLKIYNLNRKKAIVGSSLIIIILLFSFGSYIDQLQRLEYIEGNPIFNYIPGWTLITNSLESFTKQIEFSNINYLMLSGTIKGGFLNIILPTIVLLFIGINAGKVMAANGIIKPAVPFIFIYSVMFLFSGITCNKIVFLLYALLRAGFEEFFYRGVIQPLLISLFKSSLYGILLTMLIFSLMHLPDFVFRLHPTPLLAVSGLFNVALFGGVMGYGVYRSGVLWPWIIIHALSNIVS